MRRITLLLTLALLLAVPLAVRADSPGYHTVAWGETLYSISRQTGVPVQSLADANGLTIDSWVYAGQVLKIPGGGSSPAASAPATTPSGVYTVRAGDTLTGIAASFGISPDTLASANGIPANGFVYTGWTLKIPGARTASGGAVPAVSSSAYIVQPGDTLSGIAVHYGVSMQSIILANNLANTMVYSGQRLLIPNGKSSAQPASAVSGGVYARVGGIPVYHQQQTLTCEEASAAMALRGALSEAQIVRAMPRSDNPFKGIRGSSNYAYYGGLTNYGTYAQGLQKGLAALGRSSSVLYGQGYADFKNSVVANLKAGKAVVWWTTWRQTYQTPQWVKTSDGQSVKLVPYEHSVAIVGASDAGVTFNDPYDATVRSASWADFQRVSAYFGNMALVVR